MQRYPPKILFLLFLVACCLPSAFIAQQKFTLLPASQSGVEFSNDIRETDVQNVLAYEYFYNGGGVATGDINNDGLPDIFFTANMKSNKLYLNKGNFQFTDITKDARVTGRKDWKTGVTMSDINGDGWLDIYVCYSGKGNANSRRNELYINNHDLSFTEKAREYGLDDMGCSTQAIFFDYDIDGDLDCYVLNHNIKAYKNVELQYLKNEYDSLAADRLYRNDNGRFIDVSKAAGISGNPISFGLGVAVSDINNDGWPDLYISNDYTEQDYLYINNANGTFSQKELYMLSHLSQFSMGSDIADYNNDGLVDILTLDMLPQDNRRQKLLQGQENYELYQQMSANGFHYQFMRNMLHLNNGNGTFSEIGQLAGISNTDWSWAGLFTDLDNDGYKDLFITNGYLRDYTNKDFLKYWGDYLVKQVVKRDSINYMDIIKLMPSTMVPKYAFRNNGDLTFQDVSAQWGLNQMALSNGAAYADLDNDGDPDLVVNNVNATASVFRNESDPANHHLKIQLKGVGKNSFGLGTKLYCYAGSKMQFLEQMPVRGYQSSVSEVLHFGLGKSILVDSLKVIWPNGKMEIMRNLSSDKNIVVDQKNAKEIFLNNKKTRQGLFSLSKPMIDFTHLQLEYNDFKRQPLMPLMLSACGPRFGSADVNGDGLDDIFIGGSQGQSSSLYVQRPNGGFEMQTSPAFEADSLSVTTDVLFFDADGDKDLDIYCVSGGYNDFSENDERLQDRLFINDGKGNYHLALAALPSMTGSKSCVAAADLDGDADIDLFVGGRVMPGKYPASPQSFLLQNDGTGKFKDVTLQLAPGLSEIGMVTDARWTDLNKDNRPDLVLCGEWLPIIVYLQNGKGLEDRTRDFFDKDVSGLWNTLELSDIDSDGDMDIIAGNHGLNTQLKASEKEPAEMYWKDFDNNGSIDPFLCYYIQGKIWPYVSRDELLDQMYPMRRKFTSYKSFADAALSDMFSPEELKNAGKWKATCLETMLFENRDGKFITRQIPLQAQFSPVYKIMMNDINKDGKVDMLLFGNNDYPRLKIGKMDANFGTVMVNDGKGNFNYLNSKETGLLVPGDVKEAALINVNGSKYLFVGINNNILMNYKVN